MKRDTAPTRTELDPSDDPAAPVTARRTAFGPAEHNAWSLSESGISLVRRPRRARPVRFAAGSQTIEIDVASSAVIVVDMQNDFCHAEGWFGQKGIDIKPMRKPIAAIAHLLPAWRRAGGAVVWLNWGVRPDTLNLSPTIQFKSRGDGRGGYEGVGYAEASPNAKGLSVVPGEWGAAVIDELPPAAGDITVFKHRLSGFWDNELDTILRHQGITTLLFAGVNTDRCVFSSLQDAAFIGYDCVLLEDACSTPSPAYVTRAIHFIVRQLHGFVAKADDLVAELADVKQATRRAVKHTAKPAVKQPARNKRSSTPLEATFRPDPQLSPAGAKKT